MWVSLRRFALVVVVIVKIIVGRSLSKDLNGAIDYLTPNARRTFTQLRQAFNKAPILQHFDPQCHIRIETDGSSYVIGGMLSQLIDLG